MNVRILLAVIGLSVLVVGCGASKPELTKEDQVQMDKLFKEGIKPDSGATTGGPAPATGGQPKPMNQDAG